MEIGESRFSLVFLLWRMDLSFRKYAAVVGVAWRASPRHRCSSLRFRLDEHGLWNGIIHNTRSFASLPCRRYGLIGDMCTQGCRTFLWRGTGVPEYDNEGRCSCSCEDASWSDHNILGRPSCVPVKIQLTFGWSALQFPWQLSATRPTTSVGRWAVNQK